MKFVTITRKAAPWLFALLGLFLFYLAFRGIDFNDLLSALYDIDISWLFVLFIPSFAGVLFRAWRWKILMKGAGENPKSWSVYHSLFFGYFINLGIPRAGEFSRCIVLERQENIPFTKSLGTVVSERVVDLFFLAGLVVLVFFLQTEELRSFSINSIYLPLKAKFQDNSGLVYTLAAIIALTFLAYRFFGKKQAQQVPYKYRRWMISLFDGMKSILGLKPGAMLLFILLSISIWVCYFFTTWLWFLALETPGISVTAAITVMIVGSLAKTVPIPAGSAGAYHFLVGGILILYGVTGLSSQTFAFLNHGYQTLFYLLLGGLSYLWLTIQFRRKDYAGKKIAL